MLFLQGKKRNGLPYPLKNFKPRLMRSIVPTATATETLVPVRNTRATRAMRLPLVPPLPLDLSRARTHKVKVEPILQWARDSLALTSTLFPTLKRKAGPEALTVAPASLVVVEGNCRMRSTHRDSPYQTFSLLQIEVANPQGLPRHNLKVTRVSHPKTLPLPFKAPQPCILTQTPRNLMLLSSSIHHSRRSATHTTLPYHHH